VQGHGVSDDGRDGIIAGLVAYTIWGFLPAFFKLVNSVAPAEILLHRVIWAVPFGALIIHVRRQWPEVRRALTHRAMLLWLATAAFFVALNWYLYIVAVQIDQVFQASLGYYINPLVYVLVGVWFFDEKLRALQIAAVVLAAIGVAVLTFSGGKLPTIALGLAFSFTIYGVIRKQIVIGGMPGLFVETLILFPVALLWFWWLYQAGNSAFAADGLRISALLVITGPLTVVPLLCFVLAARRLSLTTIGFMQFLAPTLQFCVGVYYGEVLTTPHLICFACIWTAVILFSTDALRRSRRRVVAPVS
jgi:chloramphenicol-sensitive protein RarD